MGGGDQFFRVGARLRFKTRGKRIRGAFQDSAGRSERTFAVFQSATPMCACIPLHELFCSSNEIEELYTGLSEGAAESRLQFFTIRIGATSRVTHSSRNVAFTSARLRIIAWAASS